MGDCLGLPIVGNSVRGGRVVRTWAEMRVEVLASKGAGAGVHVEVRIVPWAVLSRAELLCLHSGY